MTHEHDRAARQMLRIDADRMETFDHIIVGSGSAGCVLANRLTADPTKPRAAPRGRRARLVAVHQDAGRHRPLWHRQSPLRLALHDRARSHPQESPRPVAARQGPRRLELDQRHGLHARPGDATTTAGRRWEIRAGATATCCPISSAWSATRAAPDDYRGGEGPLRVSNLRTTHPLSELFIAAAQTSGIPLNPDFAGRTIEGVGPVQATQRRGWRHSAADAYLQAGAPPAQPRHPAHGRMVEPHQLRRQARHGRRLSPAGRLDRKRRGRPLGHPERAAPWPRRNC